MKKAIILIAILIACSAWTHGVTTAPYVITGVYPALGYITVVETTSDSSFSLLAGTKTVVYTPASILQASYSVTQF